MILALDAALSGCCAGVVRDGVVLAARTAPGRRGNAAALPSMVQDVLQQAGVAPAQLTLVAVTVGPGSFTGLRAAISLAQGIALAAGTKLAGVTVAEALTEHAPPGRAFWVAIEARRGFLFLDRDGAVTSLADAALPPAPARVAVAGDAAIAVAARLAAQGVDVQLTALRRPEPGGIALAALRRAGAGLPPHPAQPLYVDPPEARPGPAHRPMPA